MLLKTLKSRILAVSLGMTIVSVGIFGYGLADIYYQHMQRCLNRSLSLLSNMIVIEYNLNEWDDELKKTISKNPQLQGFLDGGLLDDLNIEIMTTVAEPTETRLQKSKLLEDGRFLILSSSTKKIDAELVDIITKRWIFFVFGFLFTSGLIYVLVRHLFAPLSQLVEHCLTCDNPEKVPDKVHGGVEIVALRDAIATLQQRISRLQNAQQESMKALTHELKTPLAQLRLRIDLADQKGDWKKESIEEAREEIDTISKKITQILHSRENHEAMDKINLYKEIEELLADLRPLSLHKELTFDISMKKTITMTLPKLAIMRVLRILIENSINYSEKDSTILLSYENGVFSLQNNIAKEKHTLIDATGKGLQIAKTLANHYCWNLLESQEEQIYKISLELLGTSSKKS
ncbi:MAG: HAMP domain-containing sensor histidine kinase [Sulfurimonadaceae bacterium]|jgi:signal transduction histidine kinase|nr:HAMP domain-containing sensor histidine kinase [Sulfurimonadaceae bacterium]